MKVLAIASTAKEVSVSDPNSFDRVSPVEDPAWQAAWETEDNYWFENFTSRPYALGPDFYERFRPAYRYGFESAQSHMGRPWEDAEPDLQAGWERYQHRGEQPSTWEEIKAAVRDAWDRVVGTANPSSEARRPNVRE
jgi:hypothetical protein